MRKILMASAALLCTAGIATAQTTPAPTGAPNAPAVTAPGASPGQMKPMNNSNTMMPDSAGTASGTPAPTGAPQAAQTTAPGASPGSMAPAPNASSGGSSDMSDMSKPATPMPMPMKTSMMTHHMHHMMAMPADGTAGSYLHIAKMAIMHHDKAMADDALSHAETRLLTRAVPQGGGIPTDDSPAVTSIEHARMALGSGNMMEASSDTDMAMQQVHHGMMGGMSGPMGN